MSIEIGSEPNAKQAKRQSANVIDIRDRSFMASYSSGRALNEIRLWSRYSFD